MDSIRFADLPPLLAPLDGGTFCGLTTTADGGHHAVVLLDGKPSSRLTWKKAGTWAKGVGGSLPTRAVAALLYAIAKAHFEPAWHWTSEEADDSWAWSCNFDYGSQGRGHKSAQGCARAVRLIHVTH